MPYFNNMFDRSAIANVLGVMELRVGYRLQYRNSQPKRDQWVSACWDMTYMPTFHEHGTVAVIATTLLDDDDKPSQPRNIAVLMCNGCAYSKPLAEDPLPALLSSLPMLHSPDFRQSRDGRGCCMRFTTTAMDMTLQFDNPELIELKEIESACLRIANDLSITSGNLKLLECVRQWTRYAKDTA